jgi:Zn-dependent peptidase ImmA (M78 family)
VSCLVIAASPFCFHPLQEICGAARKRQTLMKEIAHFLYLTTKQLMLLGLDTALRTRSSSTMDSAHQLCNILPGISGHAI